MGRTQAPVATPEQFRAGIAAERMQPARAGTAGSTRPRAAAPGGAEVVARRTRKGRLTLLALAFVCALPVIASYLAFYVWQPEGRTNYGELLNPVPLPDAMLDGVAGQPALPRSEMNGRWNLVYGGAGACDAACEHALYVMRQSRLAQGKEMERVARVWLVIGEAEPSPDVLARHDGLRLVRAGAGWLSQLPGAETGQHFYLVDPLGNVMMRFPPQADAKRVIKDLERLLKYSALGR